MADNKISDLSGLRPFAQNLEVGQPGVMTKKVASGRRLCGRAAASTRHVLRRHWFTLPQPIPPRRHAHRPCPPSLLTLLSARSWTSAATACARCRACAACPSWWSCTPGRTS